MSLMPNSALPGLQQTVTDLQRQLAGALAERDEALARETATAEVLQVINSSPGDLTPVFDAILEKAHHLCGAAHGVFGTYNGDYFRAVASRGLPAAVLESLKHGFHGLENPITRPLFDGARFVQIPDLREIDHPIPKTVSALGGFRTVLFVPLRKEGTLLGHITALRSDVRPFSDKQITLLENFAAQAVIAMENARLITETREALDQQTGTAEILSVINNSPGELTPVFDAMLDRALRLCEGSFGTLFTFDGEFFHQAATRNRKVPIDRPFRPGPKSAGGRLMRGERFVHITDARDDEAYRSDDPARVRLVDGEGACSYLAVPMRKGEVLLGNIAIYRQEVRPFTDKQIALLENFAAQAVIAMENARLITETREALEQQTATAEVLGVINASPGDLAPVFGAMLDKAMRLCEADIGNFWTYDGEGFVPAVMRGARNEHVEWAMQRPRRGGFGSISAQLIEGDNLIHIADAADTDAYRAGDPARRAMVDLNGGRTTRSGAAQKRAIAGIHNRLSS